MKPSRRKPRPSQFLNGIDLWAFPCVQLVLLIILMPVVVTHPLHTVDLARTEHPTTMPGASREDAMLVALTRDGNIFFKTAQVSSDQLPSRIRESLHNGSERKVYLKVDARAKYSDAAAVIVQIRQAGVEDVGIITEQREPPPR